MSTRTAAKATVAALATLAPMLVSSAGDALAVADAATVLEGPAVFYNSCSASIAIVISYPTPDEVHIAVARWSWPFQDNPNACLPYENVFKGSGDPESGWTGRAMWAEQGCASLLCRGDVRILPSGAGTYDVWLNGIRVWGTVRAAL